ncbi:hypothetical protein OCC_11367 [Thermococcus litoralis DSM 5473]|uniref:Uncharacterized protein n=1 Tax=Thermococcus litoralis (strain ATCC 51850 / DSM 5473 / JCM 8560 / NS-C) TaxID=523849 RepID=H3ZNB4_THELN|nr:hypothetical protein [Thermococcus litoralis]EHR78538.1 hypothetical protein OCC_11367 [Thermococcus litoralis DSM 5473]
MASLARWLRRNHRELLALYFIYCILFNLLIPSTSLVAPAVDSTPGQEFGKHVELGGKTYRALFSCWNSTRDAVGYRYLSCRFSVLEKLPVSRGIKVGFSSSDPDIRFESAGGDLILKILPDSRGELEIKLDITILDVWWIGVAIPHHERVDMALNCREEGCELTSLERRE